MVAHLIAVDDLVGRLGRRYRCSHRRPADRSRRSHRLSCPQRRGTVEHELHVAGAGRLGGQQDLLRQVAGEDELLPAAVTL